MTTRLSDIAEPSRRDAAPHGGFSRVFASLQERSSMTRITATLFLLAALLFLFALDRYELRSSTEPRVAGAAADMLIYGDWVIPKLNGEPFLEKPPLSLWLESAAMKLFGITPGAARLASALAGIGTALVVFGALRLWRRPPGEALLAGVLLITMAGFWTNTRQVGEDALLTFGTTLALCAFFQASRHRDRRAWKLFALGIAIATLSKGMLGLALTGVVIFSYLLITSVQKRRLYIGDWLRPALMTLIGLIPLCIWLFFLYQRGGGDAVVEILFANSIGRFKGDFDNGGHFEPIYYYFTKLPEIFQPWTLLALLGLWSCLKKAGGDRTALFLACWVLAPFILLSLSSGKRMVYLMALYPAAAIIAAHYCCALWRRFVARDKAAARSLRMLSLLYALLLSGLAIGLVAMLIHHKIPLFIAIAIGALLALCCVALWRALLNREYPGFAAGCAAIISIAYLAYAALILPAQDHKETFAPLFAQLQTQQNAGDQLALYQPSERLSGGAVFYTGARLPELNDADALRNWLGSSENHVAVLEAGIAPDLQGLSIVRTFRVGSRDYYFLAR